MIQRYSYSKREVGQFPARLASGALRGRYDGVRERNSSAGEHFQRTDASLSESDASERILLDLLNPPLENEKRSQLERKTRASEVIDRSAGSIARRDVAGVASLRRS